MITDRKRRGAVRDERGEQIAGGLRWTSRWSLRVVVIAAGCAVVGYVLGRFWTIVMPVVIGLFLASVLWPVVAWLRRHAWPAALAAAVVLLGSLAVVAGVVALIIPSVVSQSGELAERTIAGLDKVQDWLHGPPFNLDPNTIAGAVDSLSDKLTSSATAIASGVFAGVTSALSLVVTAVTALFLLFFFLKDGPRFLPWLERTVGVRAGRPIREAMMRSWTVLGSFMRTQAIVSLVDAVLIGGGLVILGVPLALPLAVLTFVGGFIPIVGAFVAGAIAVLIALVANGLTTAIIVLVIIIVVQQLEGNVLQPLLQSRSMNVHAAVVLLAVSAGGSLYGITGAFLAVPVVAVVSEVARYLLSNSASESENEPVPAQRAADA
jgi:predicted PurR-regulated permease PerM